MADQTPIRITEDVRWVPSARVRSALVQIHAEEVGKKFISDAQDFWNHASSLLTVGVRLVLLGTVWLLLRGAERIGVLESGWAKRRNA